MILFSHARFKATGPLATISR
jgi:hypothetical protein